MRKKNGPKDKYELLSFYIITVTILITFALFLWFIWWYNIDRPINTYAKEANDWNNAIDGKDSSVNNLNVLTKLKKYKQYFTSAEDFKKYFNDKNSRSQVYNSYWYYLHFNNVTKDDGTDQIKMVVNDYNAFNNARKKYLKSSDKVVLKVIIIIIWILISIMLFLVLLLAFNDMLKSWKINNVKSELKTLMHVNNRLPDDAWNENDNTIKTEARDQLTYMERMHMMQLIVRLRDMYDA